MADPVDDSGSQQDQIDGIRAEQQRQGTAIDRILGILSGDDRKPASNPEPEPAQDITEQMRQAVRDVRAEEATTAAAAAKPEPEQPPREPGKRRERMQGILFGKEAKR